MRLLPLKNLLELTAVALIGAALAVAQANKTGAPQLLPSPLKLVIKQLEGTALQIDLLPPNTDAVDAVPNGSGFWLTESGYVATCWHVVDHVPPGGGIFVRTPLESNLGEKPGLLKHANWTGSDAVLVAKDEHLDVAILKTSVEFPKHGSSVETGMGPVHLRIAHLQQQLPEPGTSSILMGFPLGDPYLIVQEGAVASVAANLPGFGNTIKILLSTVANPGNSGGPVFNDRGQVVGLLEGALPSRQGKDPAQAVSGLAVVVPVDALIALAERSHIQLDIHQPIQ